MDSKTLKHLCMLAKLELSGPEEADFAAKFDRLLAFVDQVQSFHPSEEQAELAVVERLELRRDVPKLFVWPESEKHSYVVPQVINFEGES